MQISCSAFRNHTAGNFGLSRGDAVRGDDRPVRPGDTFHPQRV